MKEMNVSINLMADYKRGTNRLWSALAEMGIHPSPYEVRDAFCHTVEDHLLEHLPRCYWNGIYALASFPQDAPAGTPVLFVGAVYRSHGWTVKDLYWDEKSPTEKNFNLELSYEAMSCVKGSALAKFEHFSF